MRRGKKQWGAHLAQLEASGLTVAEYARRHGLNAKTLHYHRWQARKQDAAKAPTSAVVPALSGIVELCAPRESRFEVQLGAGRRVLVPPGFNDDELRRLLSLLEGAR
jgi:transposase-like protein